MAWYDPLLDRLLSLTDADSGFVSAIQHLKTALEGGGESVGLTDVPLRQGWLSARDPALEQLHVLVNKLAGSVLATGRKTELDWIAESGGEVRDQAGTAEALRRLLAVRTQLDSSQRACQALMPVVRIQFLRGHTSLRTPARAVIPSMVALDAVAVTDTEADLASIVRHCDQALQALQRAIDTVAKPESDTAPVPPSGVKLSLALR